MHKYWSLLLFCLNFVAGSSGPDKHKICAGSDMGISHTSGNNKIEHLKRRYENCTKIVGNLELTHLKQSDLDKANVTSIDFIFSRLEQITGYFLLVNTELITLSFPNLEVIFGDTYFTPAGVNASVHIQNNQYLRYINFRKLRVIDRGLVTNTRNPHLCALHSTVDWTQLFNEDVSTRLVAPTANPQCAPTQFQCHPTCQKNRCWGPNKDMCQTIYRDNCAAQCSNPGMRQCYAPQDSQSCCHSSCAGGCTGPLNTNCTLCAWYSNEDECVDACPRTMIYNPKTKQREANPRGKYTHGRQCVDECPAQMDVFDDMCLTSCPKDHYADKENGNICKPCNGVCPKTCATKRVNNVPEAITGSWIQELANCTKLNGPLILNTGTLKTSFDSSMKRTTLRIKDLEILSSIREVTEYVYVGDLDSSGQLKDLSFLRNLEVIHGKSFKNNLWSLYIGNNNFLEELGLVSLRDGSIMAGSVFIRDNPNLCFANVGRNWTKLFLNPGKSRSSIGANRSPEVCRDQGDVCDENCDQQDGCWGKEADHCYSCTKYKLDKICVDKCEPTEGFYNVDKMCYRCHEQCAVCFGPGASGNCTRCKHVRLDEQCLPECPITHYTNDSVCMPCSKACYSFGCTGPASHVNLGGCNQCNYAVIKDGEIDRCLYDESRNEHKICSSNQLDNYFAAAPGHWSEIVDKYVCDECDDTCLSCTGKGREVINHGCHCKHYTVHQMHAVTNRTNDVCDFHCPTNYYESSSSDCASCHQECRETCDGPYPSNCSQCQNLKVEFPDGGFTCVAECPPELMFVSQSTCVNIDFEALRQSQQKTKTIATAVSVAVLALFLFVCAGAAYVFRAKYKNMEVFNRFFKMTVSDMEMEPNPDAKPNMSKLRIISANEISRGRRLGSGAFGVVYQGLWTVREADQPTVKVPVALKELLDMSPAAQKEALNEAAVMASLNHPHLLKLVGVCISDSLMLITPLMLLGNLLDYVRNNSNTIGSEHLLRWITQIASAMEYLEQHRYVHRDLAARNVLVYNPSRVFVTDFGLAKMIDYGEKEVFVEGRVPVKWLALECIRYHRFTHKSDVWAFGVTAWELLNFGAKKPYGDTPITQIPALLERGERLGQPPCATIDVYLALVSCWLVDTDSRPNFKELREKFSEMCKDPPRYLNIENDRDRRGPRCGDENERQLITDIWGDDPSLVSVGEYFDSGITTPSTPASPASPSKPLMTLPPNRRPANANRNPSTGSYRYQLSPFKKLESHQEEGNTIEGDDPCFSASTSQKSVDSRGLATDDDNYLIPDRKVASMINNDDFYPEPYTPIILMNASAGKPPYYNIVQPVKNGSAVIAIENKENDTALANDVYMQSENEHSVDAETTV